MTTALLSLGSNLGDPYAQIACAHQFFGPWSVATSRLYRTAPWGVTDQPDFLNTALVVTDPAADPATWLRRAHAAEQHAHRERTLRWGPRTLDVDIIACWDSETGEQLRSDDPALTLPHPRAEERAFVLIPALEALELTEQRPETGKLAFAHALITRFREALCNLPAAEQLGVRLENPEQSEGGAV